MDEAERKRCELQQLHEEQTIALQDAQRKLQACIQHKEETCSEITRVKADLKQHEQLLNDASDDAGIAQLMASIPLNLQIPSSLIVNERSLKNQSA